MGQAMGSRQTLVSPVCIRLNEQPQKDPASLFSVSFSAQEGLSPCLNLYIFNRESHGVTEHDTRLDDYTLYVSVTVLSLGFLKVPKVCQCPTFSRVT